MNSQIFPNNTTLESSHSHSIDTYHWHTPAIQWISIVMLIATVILFPERPAWGSDVVIEADSAGIKGAAYGARLTDVLEVLADETGTTIFMDQEMAETQVYFNIPDAIPAERAIRIILHPYSHALVYVGTSDPLEIQIDQIRVYYANPTTSASEPSIAQTTDSDVDEDASDETQLLALPIAYGTE